MNTGTPDARFDEYLARWSLTPDGEPIFTHSSRLLPVRYGAVPAMLKVALHAEEKAGGALMRWWDGDGAAGVLACGDDALVLERAEGSRSLAWMARNGEDDAATRILCRAAARLHAPRPRPLPPLVPLTRWFAGLESAARQYGGVLVPAAETAALLLASPRDEVPLHGDIHHGNILDFGPHGWRAIDPKGLYGERGFDYANIFNNPDSAAASDPVTLSRRADIVAEEARLDRRRLLQWVLAYTGLSTAWCLLDDETPTATLAVAETARVALEARQP